ncbi:MAG: histidinol-phosphate transaminase [Methanomicrobiaceae archaeon]|nr:histidinol-phosphate transaminase [Methanomicrobiaceae archaeon]
MRKDIPHKVIHGDRIIRLREITGKKLLDFGANLNPFPPEIGWIPDVSMLASYPDDSYHRLKEAIGHQIARDIEEICVGNGSVELIRSFCYAALSAGDGVYIPHPTFGEYLVSARLAGAGEVADPADAKVRFLCNPNNPTGSLLSRDRVIDLLGQAERYDQILCVDEAFIDLADPHQSVIDIASPHLFVLRSLTKSFAVPGLRVGFGCGDTDLASIIEAIRPPWTVNCFAEDFAVRCLARSDDLAQSRRAIAAEREWLKNAFDALGIAHRPSDTNFILLDLDEPAADLAGRLLAHGVVVRDCASFGLLHSIRVAVRTHEENRQLVRALEVCLR